MSSSEPIILYDIPSKEPCKTWSLNPWKTRLVLNYKGLDYKTEWTEYPDIAGKLKAFGIQPHPSDTSAADYTLPAIRLPSGEHKMDSLPIARQLESLHPTPSLHLSSPYLERLTTHLPKAQMALSPVFVPRVARMLLNPRSEEYFVRTREKRYGKTLSELEHGPEGGAAAWKAAEPHLKEIAGMLREDSAGPYFMGKDVSYADFVLVGFLAMYDRIGQLDGVLAVDKEAFDAVYEGCKKWLERDDH